MRLRTTLLGLLLVIAIILAGTVYAGFSLHKADIVATEQSSLNATAQSVAQNLDTRLGEKRTMVRLAAANPHVVPGDPDGHPTDTVHRFVAETGLDGASVVDANGTLRAIAARNLTEAQRQDLLGANLSSRAYVQRALSGETAIGDPFRAESGNTIIAISTPISREGEIVGAFTGTIHLHRSSLFRDLGSSLEDDQLVLLSHNGTELYRTETSPADALTASRRAPLSDWTVTIQEDRTGLEQALFAASIAQFGAVGIAILSIAFVGVWISRTTLGNIRGLITGLNRLESGDYDHAIDLGRTAEWRQISSHFNSLAETLEQRESQLRVLNRVLRHNLRNDMSVIIAQSETILSDGVTPETTQQVETIRRTAYNLIQTSEHARAIYEDLLSEENIQRRPVNLVDIVESTTETVHDEFPESSLETHTPEEAWVLDGDTIPIVVDELCRNALIHNDLPPADRELTVAVEELESEMVRLVVQDNGPGLPEVEAKLLTGDRQETSIEHGSGLGLWVVNWLVAQLGGDISLETASTGGSRVTVRFPATSPDAETAET